MKIKKLVDTFCTPPSTIQKYAEMFLFHCSKIEGPNYLFSLFGLDVYIYDVWYTYTLCAFIWKCQITIYSKRHFLIQNQLHFSLFKNLLKTVNWTKSVKTISTWITPKTHTKKKTIKSRIKAINIKWS